VHVGFAVSRIAIELRSGLVWLTSLAERG